MKNQLIQIYQREEQEEEEVDETVDSTKPGLFYSPPKSNYQPPGGGANTSGNDSSTTDLIIPEESSDICIQKQSEGKYSCSRDDRHGVRHKHRRHEWQCKHGSLSSMFVCLFFSHGLVWVCSETLPSGKLCQLIHDYGKGFI